MKTLRKFVWLMVPGIAALCASCTSPGYRNEVYPGQQGQYTIKQVPVAPEQSTASVNTPSQSVPIASESHAPSSTPPSAAAASDPVESDEDFAQIKANWPRLTPSDRAAVADMTRRLAARSPASP